ncbi:MAG: spore cortex biosynthesis protein YabQ [Firmicutes bacterium]|nr:spore cortex biosynthesis protein YabQ [Bacillota bacterium]
MIFGEITFGQQFGSFAWALLMGAVVCVVYDLLRAWRRVRRSSPLWVNVQDVLFFALAALAEFCLCIVRCRGRVRMFVVVAVLLGAAVARFLFSDAVLAAVSALLRALFSVAQWCKRRIFAPVLQFVTWFAKKCLKIGRFIAKKVKNILQKARGLMYNKQDRQEGDNSR